MRDLKGNMVVVTGASTGIGKAVSLAFAQEGCQLGLVARSLQGLNETKAAIEAIGGSATVFETDIASSDAINELAAAIMSSFGQIDILWNGASGYIDGPLESSDEAELSYFVDTSIRGPILLTRALLPLLLRSHAPHVINVVADWEFPENSGLSAFIAAKRALAGFGIALQKEKNGKIRVTNLHPADVASKDSDFQEAPSSVLQRHCGKMIPLKELAEIVIFITKLEATSVHQIDLKPLNQEIGVSYI